MDMPARLTALLAGTLLAAAAQAQPKAGGKADAPALYQVEIIVFARSDASPTEEMFPGTPPAAPRPEYEYAALVPDVFDFDAAETIDVPQAAETAPPGTSAPPPAPAQAPGPTEQAGQAEDSTAVAGGAPAGDAAGAGAGTVAGAGGAADQAASTGPVIGPLGFTVVGPDGLKLDAAYAKLERLDAYTPLLHAAWIQPALPEEQTRPVAMADLGALNPSGTVGLYASRYLHVNVDLDYRPTGAQWTALQNAAGDSSAAPVVAGAGDTGPAVGAAPSGAGAFLPASGGESLEEISLGPRLTIKTSRRVGAGEIQYFDHPYFGLLVLVTPYEPKAEGAPAADVPPAA